MYRWEIFFLIITHFLISLSLSFSLLLSNLRSHTILSLSLSHSLCRILSFILTFIFVLSFPITIGVSPTGRYWSAFRLRRSSQEQPEVELRRNALPSWDTDSSPRNSGQRLQTKNVIHETLAWNPLSRSSIIAQFLTLSLVTLLERRSKRLDYLAIIRFFFLLYSIIS